MAKKSSPTSGTLEPFVAESCLLNRCAIMQSGDETAHKVKGKGKHSLTYVALDEVGRGCLAGPMVVCATAWTLCTSSAEQPPWLSQLRDSKKLSAAQRETLFRFLTQEFGAPASWRRRQASGGDANATMPLLASGTAQLMLPKQTHKFSQTDVTRWAMKLKTAQMRSFKLVGASIGAASAQEIDHHGLTLALGAAAQRALSSLIPSNNVAILFFDGNRPLKLAERWAQIPQCLVTQGDDCLKSISASSILAKVVRDLWMNEYSQSFPQFEFTSNKGYGTQSHRDALERVGPTDIHRLSFLKNICPAMIP